MCLYGKAGLEEGEKLLTQLNRSFNYSRHKLQDYLL